MHWLQRDVEGLSKAKVPSGRSQKSKPWFFANLGAREKKVPSLVAS